MKYIVLLCDGMSDLPCDELGGKTPMTVAKKPNMDLLAKTSQAGLAKTVPDNLPPGSDVANLSVLGYNPAEYYTGRSPFEAASMGIQMTPDDVAVRCNLVTLSKAENFADAVMLSYCADDIQTQQAAKVIAGVNEKFRNPNMEFFVGISYRHCLLWKNGKTNLEMIPPHDIIGKRIGDYIKVNAQNRVLYEMMEEWYRFNPANCIWLWSEGKKAELPLFRDEFGVDACMISAVDLLKGIGKIAGMDVLHVEGATGYIDTNFCGKAAAAIDWLKNGGDLAYIHLEAPDECGHRGEVDNKVKAIELIDELVLGAILKAFDSGEFGGQGLRILIAPDHPTPLNIKTHTRDPVPFLIWDSQVKHSGVEAFDEFNAENTGIYIEKGYQLMRKFLCLKNN